MDIAKFIITGDMPIYEAASAINANERAIVFICDGGRVLASLSDGDIRRHVMANGDFSAPVKAIANYSVRCLPIERQAEAAAMAHDQKLKAIPIVDKNGLIVAIKFDDSAEARREVRLDAPVVIMAGGRGTRLAPYTGVLPKPLMPVGEKTITEHILDRFCAYGCEEFHIIVNYKRELIKAYFQDFQSARIIFHDEAEYLGTGGGLRLLEGALCSTFFMTNCDILIDDDYAAMLSQHKASGDILTMTCSMKSYQIPYGTVELNGGGRVKGLTEKPEFPLLVNTGLYIIEPAFLELIGDGPAAMTDLIETAIARGETVGVYPISENGWMDMGEMAPMNAMRRRIELGQAGGS